MTTSAHKGGYSRKPKPRTALSAARGRAKRNVSSVKRKLTDEAIQTKARDRVLQELGAGVCLSDRAIQRCLRKLGAA
jgi:hypothetical protein